MDPASETETGMSGPWAPEAEIETEAAQAEAAPAEGIEGGTENASLLDGIVPSRLRKGSA